MRNSAMINRNCLRAALSAFFFFTTSYTTLAFTAFPADSIRVKWMEGRKYILHKVEPRETWMNLARRYNCSMIDLRSSNEGVEELKIGQIINIPVLPVSSDPATKVKELPGPASPGKGNATVSKTPVTYAVKKGETLYSIAKRYSMSVQDMKSINKLTGDVLSEGQVLVVGFKESRVSSAHVSNADRQTATPSEPVLAEKPSGAATPGGSSRETGVIPSAAGMEKPTKSISPVKKGSTGKTLMQITETGVASWIRDGGINQDKYYALHRTAAIGTIVKVTNRMNNQFVYVKVVGTLPDTGDNENIIIKVSQAVSSKLNALDPLFQAELSYGVMQ